MCGLRRATGDFPPDGPKKKKKKAFETLSWGKTKLNSIGIGEDLGPREKTEETQHEYDNETRRARLEQAQKYRAPREAACRCGPVKRTR